MYRNFDLKKVLVMAFASISIGAIILISSLNALSTYQTAKSTLKETLTISAQTVAIRVDGYVSSILSALKAGVINQSNKVIDVDHDIRHQALIKVLASHEGLREVWSVNEKGEVLELVSRFSVAHTEGLAELWSPPIDKDVRVGDVLFSEILLTETSNEPLINVAVPLYRGGRLTGGMIVASLSLKYLWDVLANLNLKETHHSFAISKDSVVVGHSNSALVFSKNLVPSETLAVFFNSERGTSREYTAAGSQSVIGGFSRVGKLGIGVVVEAPEEEAFQAAIDGIVLTIMASLAGILISIWAGLYLARILVKPLLKLSEAAEEIASARNYQEVDIAGTTETRVLGTAFNKMTRRLSNSISQLKKEVAAKQKTERVLRESEERFRSLIENTLDIILLMDGEGKIQFVTPSIYRILGYRADEVIGKFVWEFFHVDDLPEMREALANSSSENSKMELSESRIRHKNGSWHLLESVGQNLLDVPAVNAIVVNSRDITERLTLEEKLRRSQKMEAVGQLTSGIAHDFNNILGVIQGNLEIMDDMVSSDNPIHSRIKKAQQGVDRGTAITRKLLGFSRKDSHLVSSVSINELVGNLENLIASSLTASIEIKTKLEKNLWKTVIDPGEFEDAILNISLNARDAMPHGGTLFIETANKQFDDEYIKNNPEAKAGDFVMVSVSDTGVGMAKDIVDKIFEPFFTTKEANKGTGLGLSMVYGFVQRAGGYLNIYSEVDKGTTFQFYLPRALDAITLNEIQKETTRELPRGKEVILVVDDEDDLRDIAESYLQDLGYITQAANSGSQALEMLQSDSSIDAIFSDVVMPGEMDGYQLAMTAHRDLPSLKILLTSGFAKGQAELVNGAINKQFMDQLNVDLLVKPYNKRELALAIRKALDFED